MRHLYIITGPSACGKTTLLLIGKNEGLWVPASKISTRKQRTGTQYDDISATYTASEIYENPRYDYKYIMNGNIYAFSSGDILERLAENNNVAIICSDLGTIKKIQNDSILQKYVVVLFVSAVPAMEQITKAWLDREKRTIVGELNDAANDLRMRCEIIQKNQLDFKELNDITSSLPNQVESLFNLGESDENNLNSYENFSSKFIKLYDKYLEMMPKSSSYRTRIRNMDKFYYKYIEEIGYFDYNIINFFNPEKTALEYDKTNFYLYTNMTTQIKNIITYLNNDANAKIDSPFMRRTRRNISNNYENSIANTYNKEPKNGGDDKYLFFICAPKRSGKAILLSNLNLLSREKIEIVRKIAMRENKNTEEELRLGKGDGYKLSETYWMFDDVKDEDYLELIRLQKGRPETIVELDKHLNKLWSAASNRINQLVEASIKNSSTDDNNKKFIEREHKFDDWNYEFQNTFYGIDICAIENKNKHSIVISNIDELERAKNIADKYEKVLVPIFLVYVDYKEHSLNYHYSLLKRENPNMGDDELMKKASALNEKIYKVIDNYCQNISKFHHVILNNGINEDVHDQISNIINLYIK